MESAISIGFTVALDFPMLTSRLNGMFFLDERGWTLRAVRKRARSHGGI